MARINPLVSVYITNYNYGKYIKQCIESLLNQTLQDFELFIIDDGSTDDSRKTIEEYAMQDKISIIYQKNKGLNITNNIALRVSRGKYIMRLDADDYLETNALQEMVNVLEADSELGLVFPDYYLVDNNNYLIGEVKRFDFKKEVSLLDQPAHGAVTMIRRDYLESLGGYDESYSCQDGYELWIKFIAQYKVQNISKSLFYYRQHGNNLTANEKKILDTRFEIKNNFIIKNNIVTPVCIGIIPIRTTLFRGQNLPLLKIGDHTLLANIVQIALNSAKLDLVVVTSADEAIREYFDEHLKDLSEKVLFVHRPVEYERINESLANTIQLVMEDHQVKALQPGAVMTLAVEYPFITTDVIDDAINTLTIFDADSLLTVRPDNSLLYQHDGNGLHPILEQEKFTRLEREAVYKAVGGIVLSRLESYTQSGKMLNGKVGHIVVDELKSLKISSLRELDYAEYLHTCKKSTQEVQI